MAPADARLVALCDQDDRWHPEKLATLRARDRRAPSSPTATSGSSTDGGEVLAETFWEGRRNNHTNLASLLVANTVTGAATLMRREVVERALPFPRPRRAGSSTTTGSRWSRWRPATSPTSTGRSTTTSSIAAPFSARWQLSRREAKPGRAS